MLVTRNYWENKTNVFQKQPTKRDFGDYKPPCSPSKSKHEVSKQVGICFKILNEVNEYKSTVKIRMISIKLLLKTLNGIYSEKATGSKDSQIIENQVKSFSLIFRHYLSIFMTTFSISMEFQI